MNISKYKSAWNKILFEYTPATGVSTIWDVLAEVFDGDDDPSTTTVVTCIFDAVIPFMPIYDYDTTAEIKGFNDDIFYWSAAHYIEWKRAWDAYTATYDPIENYHRTGYKQEVLDGASTNDTTTTAHVAPDSSETFYNTGKSVVDQDTTTDNTTTINTEDKGNVGVTTSQQMIEAELQLRSHNFIETYIVRPFIKEFCVAVY